MSHQTGIRANEKLNKIFGKSKNGKVRVIKISIENEELICSGTADVSKDWKKDYVNLVLPLLHDDTPCYILFRLENKTDIGYTWLLLTWVPETANVRQRMMYASTKATLKKDFGSAYIAEEQHATSKEDVTLESYLRNKQDHLTPGPLTTREEEIAELRKTELKTDISIETRQQTLGGISCPLSDDTEKAIYEMIKGKYNYLQFRIDLEEERIHFCNGALINVEELSKQIPNDCARYHIYLFKHTYESDYQESYVFIYSMPGYTCSVRERMMYSSCKAPFIETLKNFNIEFVKKLEIDDGSEVTEQYLLDELHPKKMLHRPAFAKPKGPPNRGARRMIHTQEEM